MRAVFLDYASFGPGDLDPGSLRQVLPGIELRADTARHELGAQLTDAAIVIVNKIVLDRAALALAPQLRLVCVAATGTDNVAIDAARERGIAVANIRDYGTPSVTQHVFALVLALTQRLGEHTAAVAAGEWSRSPHFCLLDRPFDELCGRRFGIVGLGTLGRSVARIAQAFGMEVVAAASTAPRPGVADPPGVRRLPLAELLGSAHVVSLHCPLDAATRHLIDAHSLALMRRDALLINTARGALVDATALLDALRGGRLAGAGIDVLEREPPPADHPLLAARLPNLIVTPHVAWAARQARQRALEEIAANIDAFRRGERRNRLD
jgi:glycerate dehydrogenase